MSEEKNVRWEQAKNLFWGMKFPDDQDKDSTRYRELDGTKHSVRGGDHDVRRYRKLIKELAGYEIFADYGYCPKCRVVRYKSLTMFNEDDHVCVVKDFVKNGSTVIIR